MIAIETHVQAPLLHRSIVDDIRCPLITLDCLTLVLPLMSIGIDIGIQALVAVGIEEEVVGCSSRLAIVEDCPVDVIQVGCSLGISEMRTVDVINWRLWRTCGDGVDDYRRVVAHHSLDADISRCNRSCRKEK